MQILPGLGSKIPWHRHSGKVFVPAGRRWNQGRRLLRWLLCRDLLYYRKGNEKINHSGKEAAPMTRLDLTEQETLSLIAILESSLSELITETAATDNREYRDMLKEKKKFIRALLERLQGNA
jgi:hypothetical protein